MQDSQVVEVNEKYMVRCRVEPDRWPLIPDVSNHQTVLNPDVPDFQPGKIWKNEDQSKKLSKSLFTINGLFYLDTTEAKKDEAGWSQVPPKRKKPTKKKVRLILKMFGHVLSCI